MAKITYYTSSKANDDNCVSGFSGRITTKSTCGIDGTTTENKNNIEPQITELPTQDKRLAELVAVQTALEHAIEMGATVGTKLSVWCEDKVIVDWIHADMHEQEFDLDSIQEEVIQTIRGHLKRLGRKKNWGIVQVRTNDNSLSKAVQEAIGLTNNASAPAKNPLDIIAEAKEKLKN